MSESPPVTTTDDLRGALPSVGTINGMLVGGVLVAGATAVTGVAPPIVGFGVGAVVVPLVLFAVGRAATRDSAVHLYEDRIETESPFESEGWGSWEDRTIPYDEVDLVVRRAGRGERLVGTGSFEVIAGGDHLKLSYLADPERVETVLNERVPDPQSQVAEAGSEAGYSLWDSWPRDVDPPADPVVDELDLAERLDVYLHGADLEELVPDMEEGSALDRGPEERLTAQDFDAGGDDSTVLGLPGWFALGVSLLVVGLGAFALFLGLLGSTPGVEGGLTPLQRTLQVGVGLLVTMLGLSFLSQTLAARAYRERSIAEG